MRWLRILLFALTSLAALAVAAIVTPFVPHVARFVSHRHDIAALIQSADPHEHPLPPMAADQMEFLFRHETAWYAARFLTVKYDTPGHGTAWQIAWAAWGIMTKLFISEPDRLTLIAALAPLGNGRTDLNAVALTDFGKPLTEITPEQSASLMVMLGCVHGNLATEAPKFLKTYQASRSP